MTTPPNSPQQPFTAWSLDDALAQLRAVQQAEIGEADYKANKRYVEDRDHWQNGNTWVGPQGTDDTRATVLTAVERQYTPSDVIGEVLDTLANAVLEREPLVGFVRRDDDSADLTEQDQQDVATLTRRLKQWADRRDLWGLLRRGVIPRSRWATWGTLRAWVPPSQLVAPESPEGQLATDEDPAPEPLPAALWPTGLSLADALDRVHVTDPEPDQAVIWQDPETRERVGIFAYTVDDVSMVELYWVDRDGLVHIKLLEQGSEPQEAVIDLKGASPLVQVSGDLLITEAVRRQQARLNFFESLMVRVAETAGFPERYIGNAQPTGIWMTTAPSDGPALKTVTDQGGTTWYLHPSPRTLGASVTQELLGVETRDVQGNPTVATPSVTFKDPTDPEYAIKACQHARRAILQSCKQGHVGMDDDATATGISRVQARAAFVADAKTTANALRLALAELVEAVLGYAAQMSPDAAKLVERFRPVVTVRVSPGPLSAEEQTAVIELRDKGVISQETAMTMLGVDDVPAEMQKIRGQPDQQLARLKTLGETMTALVGAGLNMGTVVKLLALAGATPDEVAILQADAAEVPVSEGPPDLKVAA